MPYHKATYLIVANETFTRLLLSPLPPLSMLSHFRGGHGTFLCRTRDGEQSDEHLYLKEQPQWTLYPSISC